MIYKPPSAERKLLDKNFKYTSIINAEAILHLWRRASAGRLLF